MRTGVGVVGVVVWLLVPLVVAAVLTARSERSVRTPPAASTWVAVGERLTEQVRPVTAVASQDAAPPLLAPAWSGLVQEIALAPGEAIRSGQVVAVVNGVPRLGAHTVRPFSRELAPGDSGADVEALNRWLSEHSWEATGGDRFGSATARGVRSLRRELGLGLDQSTLDPAWVVYLPSAEVVVATTTLQVGAPAPGAGSVIAELQPQVVTVQIFDDTSAGLAPDQLPAPDFDAGADADPDPDGPEADPAAAEADDRTGPAEPLPPAAGDDQPPGGSDSAQPGSGPSTSPGANPEGGLGVPLTSAAEGARLRRQGRDLGPIGADGSIPAETLAALEPLLADGPVGVDLVEPAPADVRVLPGAAVFSGPNGLTCVAIRTGPGTPTQVGPVMVLGATGDRTRVAGLPDGATEVEVNALPEVRRRCGA